MCAGSWPYAQHHATARSPVEYEALAAHPLDRRQSLPHGGTGREMKMSSDRRDTACDNFPLNVFEKGIDVLRCRSTEVHVV